MTTEQVITWVINGVMSGAAVFIAKKLTHMESSIENLNGSMKQAFERFDWHGRELNEQRSQAGHLREVVENHASRISVLENTICTKRSN